MIIRAYNENEEVFDTLNVTVQPVNDLPYFLNIPDTLEVRGETTFSLDYSEYAQDTEDLFENLSFEFLIDSDVDSLEFPITVEGDSLYISMPEYVGFVTLTMRVTDSGGETIEASIVLNILEATSGEYLPEPDDFQLSQNYPNPFNPSTVISYQISVSSEVSLKVFDMLGREVASLVHGRKAAGQYHVTFDASGLSSGMYIYRLTANNFVDTRRMMLIK